MKYRSTSPALALAIAAFAALPAHASIADSVLVLKPVEVTATRVRFGASKIAAGRGDLQRALQKLGLLSVRRGVPIASDLAVEGFKRADLHVTVDGERYHCACPNRMDPPTSLALPAEVASITREMSASASGAALAGRIAIERAPLEDPWQVSGGVTALAGREDDVDASIAIDGRRHRVSARWADGFSYRDGSGASFGQRYGFRDADVRYRQGDVALRGEVAGWAWGGSFSLTRDVPYAYLLMDERRNEIASVSIARGGTKLYATRARHVMDNGLRAGTMVMSTDAGQTTVGLTGRIGALDAEAWGRGWEADNRIVQGRMVVRNHLIPGYRQGYAGLGGSRTLAGVTTAVRLALTRAWITDESALAHHRLAAPGATGGRWFVPFAVAASVGGRSAHGWTAGAGLEVASEPPTAEQLFITVRRPVMMGMPRRADWVGHPGLAAPLRASVRGRLQRGPWSLEGHMSWLDAYVLPVATRAGGSPTLTYRGVNAVITALTARGAVGPAEAMLAWTSGQNLADGGPLAEIAPLQGSLAVRTPARGGVRAVARALGAARAWRVDPVLGETASAAWARFDLGLEWHDHRGFAVELAVENVGDALYAEHLSFLRDPFAAGGRVYEPGRLVRLAVTRGR